MVRARRIILATGAMERPFPIPGWTLPGVMTVGAAQTVLKASGLVPEGRIVLAGCGPLLWLCAYQLLKAGCPIQAILDTTDAAARRDAMRHAPEFARSHYLAKGIKLMAYVRRKVRVIGRVTALSAHGDGRLDSISYIAKSGMPERMPADYLLLHQGVIPNVNLAMSIGVPHTWDGVQLCWTPPVDSFGTTPVEGIAIAGDGAGIAGGRAAADRGRLAGIAAVRAIDPHRTGLPDELAIRRDLDHALARPRLHRQALPAGAHVPHSGRRHDRLPLRGDHRRPDPRSGRNRRRGAEPAEVVPALRHGAVPGAAVRHHRHRS